MPHRRAARREAVVSSTVAHAPGRALPAGLPKGASVVGFLKLCYTPALAAEVTLQPLSLTADRSAAVRLLGSVLLVPKGFGRCIQSFEVDIGAPCPMSPFPQSVKDYGVDGGFFGVWVHDFKIWEN